MLQNYGQVRADVPSPHFKRQALIFYGRETINLLKWSADELDDAMKEKALELGLACLRAAGTSVDTMDESIFGSETVTPYERLFEKARVILMHDNPTSPSQTVPEDQKGRSTLQE